MGFSLTPMVKNLLIGTIIMFLLQNLFTFINPYLSLYHFLSPHFLPFQLVTYIFLHGSLGHIFSNMIGLAIFGPMLERVWGGGRFLVFYLLTGIGAGLIQNAINHYEFVQMQEAANQYLTAPSAINLVDYFRDHLSGAYQFNPQFLEDFEKNPGNAEYIRESKQLVLRSVDEFINNPNMRTVGASGAVFGIMAAFALLFPNTELFLLFIPFPIKAKYFVILYGVMEYFSGIQRTPGDNVAHFAHLGGMFFGFILVKIWGTDKKRFY